MRRMIPSLPIFAALTSTLDLTSAAAAELIPEAVVKPRFRVDSRNDLQLHAARAAPLEPASAQHEERHADVTLVERQGDYYAFSGAVYIVGAGGAPLSGLNAASPAYCPNNAPQSCGNIGVWNWCCQSGYTCQWADWQQTYVGCCPPGQTCQQGSINKNSVSTVTVYITTTQYGHGGGGPPTNVVIQGGGQQQQTTTVPNNGGGGIVIVGTTTAQVTYADFCTTIYAQNVDTPTRAAVPCGVALVVGDAQRPQVWHALGILGTIWTLLSGYIIFFRFLR